MTAKRLSSRCDGNHKHSPFGVIETGGFATADEADYLRFFCGRVAGCIVSQLQKI